MINKILLGFTILLFISNIWLLTERVRLTVQEKYCLDTLTLYYNHFKATK